MVESTAKLREEILALSGVDIMEDANTFKSTYKIMDELAAKWQDLTDIQQASITELIAGKRQGNIVSSLMSNFDTAREALEVSLSSEGSAMTEHRKWSESIEAYLNRLKASWQSFSQTFMDSDSLKSAITVLTKLLDILEKLIDNFGLLGTIGLGVAGKGLFGYLKNSDIFSSLKVSSIEAAGDIAEAMGDISESVGNTIEAMGNGAEVVGDTVEAMSSVTEATGDIVEATGDTAEGIGNLIEAMGNGAEVVGDTVEATGSIVEAAGDGAEAMGDLAVVTTKTTGGFKAFMKTPIGVASAIGVLVAAIGLAINAYKNYREEQSMARQETIDTSNEFLDSALAFEQAYVKYSGKTNLTVEEESELESAINGTVQALDDKTSALQNVVNGSSSYIDSLEQIARAELDAAATAAKSKRDAAKTELYEAAMGWTNLNGSNVNLGIHNKEALAIAKDIGNEYFGEIKHTRDFVLEGFTLDKDADIDDILDYYYMLTEYQEKLSDADLVDIDDYKNVTDIIDKMSGSISTYVEGVYDAAKAEYQLANGIPKTTEEYLRMRESVLNDMGDAPLSIKKMIAGTFDNEYRQMFDLSDAKVQSRKLIGVLDEFGDAEASQVETFLNMKTAVNNNECTVGDYMSQFDEINAMTQGWDEKSKEEFNIAFGIDSDNIKNQYDDLYNYLSNQDLPWFDDYEFTPEFRLQKENIKDEEIRKFLDDLTANELTAFASIRTEIDLENASIEDVRKILQEQVDINEALAFTTDIEIDTTALELLNTALTESASAMGLTEESIDSLKARYAELENFDASTLFEATGNGIKVNRDELVKLEKEYNNLTKSKVKKHLETLADEYNDVTKEIDKCTDTGERARLLSKRETYKSQIEELAEYQAQLEGVTGAYQRWIDAQNTPEDYEGYQAVATSREDIQNEIDRGFISNATKEYIDLLSGEDLTGGTIDDYYEAWEKLDKKVGSTSYTIHDFFTVNDDGDITSQGIDRFFDGIQQDFKGSVYKFNEDTGEWYYDFSQENLQKIKGEWNIGIESIELLLEAAAAAGYDIDWGGILDNIDLDTSNFESLVSVAENAQKELNKLKGYEDIDFNFSTTNVEDATSELDKAQDVYNELVTNDDGTINIDAKGADNVRVILATLLVQKQQLEDSEIAINISTSGLDESQAKAVAWVQDFRAKYKNLEIAISTGEGIEEAKTELETVKTSLGELDGDTAKIAAQLVLGENTDTSGDGFKTQVNNAIDSIGKQNINVGFKLDGTSINNLNSQLLTNFTVDATAKITNVDKSQLETVETGGMVTWDENTDNVSKSFEADGKVNWSDGLKNITTSFSANGTVNWTSGNKVKVKVISEAYGTAHANGSTGRSFARGNWGIKGNGTALGGELAPELLIRDGKWHLIGEDGAEFFNYRQNDIIFNAAQTESLFKYGGIKGAKPRGKMLANGSAFAGGNAFAWNAITSESDFANNKNYNKKKTEAKTKTKTTAKDDSVTTTTTTSWNAKSSNGGKYANNKDYSSTEKYEKKEFEETFDWIEVAIKRVEQEIDKLDKQTNRTYTSWSSRNAALEGEILKVNEAYSLQKDAAQAYLAEANKAGAGLSQDWIDKIQYGLIDVDTLNQDNISEGELEKIKNYQKWYELYLQCEQAAEDLKDTEAELYRQNFDNVVSKYDGKLDAIENMMSIMEQDIELSKYTNHISSSNNDSYNRLINQEKNTINQLTAKKIELEQALNEAIRNGLSTNSEDYQEMRNEIDAITLTIKESTTNISQYYRDMFDEVSDKYDAILQGYEHTESMLNEYISQSEAKGQIVSKNYYQALIDNEKANISQLKKEQSALIKARDNAVKSGNIAKYSQEWYEMSNSIDEVTRAIEESNTALIEHSNSMRDIDWHIFDLTQQRISDITDEAEFLIELMSNENLFDDKGKLTDQGLATMGLRAQNYNTHMYQVDNYGEEAAKIEAQLAKGYDENLEERRRELIELQRESILAAEDEKNAIRDLVEESINEELDALDELIEKKNEALESEKD